jgi:nicotinate-nucleotide adenylyltransferase
VGRVTNPQSLGVLGGTFDPPHYGHLALAENARVQLELDRVLFVPAGQPPHKTNRPTTPAHHRAAMVQAAIADHPAFALSRVDLDRPGPHYTVEMLALLGQAYPGADLYFLIGGDSLAEFPTWRDSAGILRLARLAVMQRPGWEAALESLERDTPGIREGLVWLDAPHLGISGTDLRRRARRGLPLRYLVPAPVEVYVREHHLYQDGSQIRNGRRIDIPSLFELGLEHLQNIPIAPGSQASLRGPRFDPAGAGGGGSQ